MSGCEGFKYMLEYWGGYPRSPDSGCGISVHPQKAVECYYLSIRLGGISQSIHPPSQKDIPEWSGKGWDKKLDEGNSLGWLKWIHNLQKVRSFIITRCLNPDGFGCISNVQLHHFCDASQDGYGAVSYLRIVGEDGYVHITFLLESLV